MLGVEVLVEIVLDFIVVRRWSCEFELPDKALFFGDRAHLAGSHDRGVQTFACKVC